METESLPPPSAPLCAVIELFGHTRVAGLISESPLGGGALIRLSVPACGPQPAHTRDINPKAVYAIHYCDEASMISALPSCQPSPVVQIVKHEVAQAYQEALRTRDASSLQLGQSAASSTAEDEDEDEPNYSSM